MTPISPEERALLLHLCRMSLVRAVEATDELADALGEDPHPGLRAIECSTENFACTVETIKKVRLIYERPDLRSAAVEILDQYASMHEVLARLIRRAVEIERERAG